MTSSDTPGTEGIIGNDALLARVRHVVRGHFDIAGLLGRGGMAAVYLGYDLHLGRKVAIKVMLPEIAVVPGMAERFLNEARTLARLHHPNVIVVHSVATGAGLPYFVMHFVEGSSLDHLRDHHRELSGAAAQCILIDVAHALQHAHAHGVVHRDVKPSNILLTPEGHAVVTDFGIARAADDERLTITGMTLGTPAYMSPEQWTGKGEISGATDQYALGVVAYELIAGQLPFRGSILQLQWAHVREPVPPLSEVCPTCPAEIAAVVMRMLEKSPDARFSSLGDVISVFSRSVGADDRDARTELGRLAVASAEKLPMPNVQIPRTPVPQGALVRPVARKPPPAAPPAVPRTVTLRLSPTVVRLEVGAKSEAIARLTTDDNKPVENVRFEWSVANPAMAQVQAHGGRAAITGLAAGQTAITVTAGGKLRRSVEVVIEPAGARSRRMGKAARRSSLSAPLQRLIAAFIVGGAFVFIRLALESFTGGGSAPVTGNTVAVMHRAESPAPVAAPTAVPRAGLLPLSDAFGFDVPPRTHPDSGDAAVAVKKFLTAIENHNVGQARASSTPGSLGPRSPVGDTAAFLIARSILAGVSLRYDEPPFIRAVYRAVSSGKSSVPFFIVLEDPTAREPMRTRRLHFTAIVAATGATVNSTTQFRLDSIRP